MVLWTNNPSLLCSCCISLCPPSMVHRGDASSSRYHHYEPNLTLAANVGPQDGRGRWTMFLLWVYRGITSEPNPVMKIARNNKNASNQAVPATETPAPLLIGTELSQHATLPRYH